MEGVKKLIASVTLPAVLFGAFARVRVDYSLFALALVIFASCAVLGLIGSLFARVARMPRPSTTFLFQGFEAGMLGYALFASLFGTAELSAFATADLGQVVFVFTALMAQLLAAEGRVGPKLVLRRLASSPAMIAIAAGLAASILLPGARGAPWGEGGFLAPLIATIASLTTPLVCLVVGYGLKDFRPAGAGKAGTAVVGRLAAAVALGSAVAFLIVPALGYGRIQSVAVLALFVLPPPFIIPVFRTETGDAAYVSAVLSIHTLASLAAAVFLATAFAGVAP
jgi:predicted permease